MMKSTMTTLETMSMIQMMNETRIVNRITTQVALRSWSRSGQVTLSISVMHSRTKTLAPAIRDMVSVPLYSMMAVTTPAPTVRPPSRIAKRSSSSIAIGVISSTSICTLSPGITISTPSGSIAVPVTSVVRK